MLTYTTEMVETATVEAPQAPKRRGRPPKYPIKTSAETQSAPSEALENDAESTIGDDSREGIPPYPEMPRFSSVEKILATWNPLTERQKEFGNLYLYREWPKQLLVIQRGRLVNENCGKFGVLDGPITLDLIKQKYRMGRYYLRLVQRVIKPYGQICQSEPFTIDGNLENIEDMPILDLEKLDRAHPDNESYLRILKLRGIIKVDGNKADEGEDMAASEVLGNLANKAIDVLSEQRQPSAGTQQPQSDIAGGVGTELVGLLREQINVNRPPAQQGTVKDQLEGLVTLAKTMTPPAAPTLDMGPYIALQTKNNELVERVMNMQIEQARAEAAKARAEADEIRQALPKPKTVDEQFDELERAAKRFDRMTGRKEREEEAEEEKQNASTSAAGFWGSLMGQLPMILDKGLELMKQTNIMIYNSKLNGSGQPPLNPSTGQPGTEPLAPETEPQLSPEDQAKMEHMQNVANQLTMLAQPMLGHLLRNKTGGEFAKFVVENYGSQSFALIRATGKETIAAMISQYPPVWDQITQQKKEFQFQQFLEDFMKYSPVAVQ